MKSVREIGGSAAKKAGWKEIPATSTAFMAATKAAAYTLSESNNILPTGI